MAKIERKKVRTGDFSRLLKRELAADLPREIVRAVNPRLAEYMALLAEEGEDTSLARAVNIAQILKALSGDLKAYETIRDTLGQKPSGDGEGLNSIKVVVEDAGKG